jgi:hypothetical protein
VASLRQCTIRPAGQARCRPLGQHRLADY